MEHEHGPDGCLACEVASLAHFDAAAGQLAAEAAAELADSARWAAARYARWERMLGRPPDRAEMRDALDT